MFLRPGLQRQGGAAPEPDLPVPQGFVMASGICMCGHSSSLHTDGGGCAAKFVNAKGEQVTCSCTFFVDKES